MLGRPDTSTPLSELFGARVTLIIIKSRCQRNEGWIPAPSTPPSAQTTEEATQKRQKQRRSSVLVPPNATRPSYQAIPCNTPIGASTRVELWISYIADIPPRSQRLDDSQIQHRVSHAHLAMHAGMVALIDLHVTCWQIVVRISH